MNNCKFTDKIDLDILVYYDKIFYNDTFFSLIPTRWGRLPSVRNGTVDLS